MLPKGLWVVRVLVHDGESHPDFLEATRPAFEKYNARFLVRGRRYLAPEAVARVIERPMPMRISVSSNGSERGRPAEVAPVENAHASNLCGLLEAHGDRDGNAYFLA